MKRALDACDMVIIPSSLAPARVTKTANRIMTSIYGGKHVVAYPLPAYLEFSNFITVKEDLANGIRRSLDNPDIVREQISNGQIYIERNYSPEKTSKMWEKVLINE